MRKDIKQIRQVLKSYARLKQDLEQFSCLPSLNFDNTGSPSNLNHMEDKFVCHADLSHQLCRIEDAINMVSEPKYRFILNSYIINKQYSRDELCDRYDVSVRTFNNLKNRALIEFAKNYGLDSLSDASLTA